MSCSSDTRPRLRTYALRRCRPHRGFVDVAWVLRCLKTRCARLSTYARFLRMGRAWSAVVKSIPERILGAVYSRVLALNDRF